MKQKTLLYPLLTFSVARAGKNKQQNNNDLWADSMFDDNWGNTGLNLAGDPWGDSFMGLNVDNWGEDKPLYLDDDKAGEAPVQRAPHKPTKIIGGKNTGSSADHFTIKNSFNSRPPKNSTEYTTFAVNRLEAQLTDENQITEIKRLQELDENNATKEDSLKKLMMQMLAEEVDDRNNKIVQDNWGQKSNNGGSSNNGNSINMKEQNNHALSNIGYLLADIWNYGCWCYFGENMSHGRGVPVNKVDETCRALNYCYTCVRIDEREINGKSCQPGQVSYNRPTGTNAATKSQEIQCEQNNNGDSCKINTCKCETQFIASLIKMFFDPKEVFEPEWLHSKGEFDPNTCGPLPPHARGLNGDDDENDDEDPQEAIGVGNGSRHIPTGIEKANGRRSCCGDYPHRKPYNDSFQSCCHKDGKIGKIFLTDERMCCRDGTVKQFCPDYVDGE